MNSAVVLMVFYWCFVQWRTLNSDSDRRGSGAAAPRTPAACWLLASSCTWSLLNIFPNFQLLMKKWTHITAGFPSRRKVDVVQEQKPASFAAWPRFPHIYCILMVEDTKRRKERSSLCMMARRQMNWTSWRSCTVFSFRNRRRFYYVMCRHSFKPVQYCSMTV